MRDIGTCAARMGTTVGRCSGTSRPVQRPRILAGITPKTTKPPSAVRHPGVRGMSGERRLGLVDGALRHASRNVRDDEQRPGVDGVDDVLARIDDAL